MAKFLKEWCLTVDDDFDESTLKRAPDGSVILDNAFPELVKAVRELAINGDPLKPFKLPDCRGQFIK